MNKNKYVNLARRENNSKRGFLIVNPYLGKHVAMNPSDILDMFDDVSALIPNDFSPEHTLVVGFAETATALGLHYAVKNHTYYIQTTRENVSDVKEYLFFSEEHSHATEQYIIKDSLNSIINNINHVIFIDDEITTGNTVLNAVKAFNNAFHKEFSYTVISVLNSMNQTHLNNFKEKNINVLYLNKIDCSDYEKTVSSYNNFKDYITYDIGYKNISNDNYFLNYLVNNKIIGSFDTRYVIHGDKYFEHYINFLNSISNRVSDLVFRNVLVLGTEEFMYPGLLFANFLSKMDNVSNIKFHATTRSPIDVSDDINYPLHEKYCIPSIYDIHRKTYIYDIYKYDCIFIVTEAKYLKPDSLNVLSEILNNNNNIYILVL